MEGGGETRVGEQGCREHMDTCMYEAESSIPLCGSLIWMLGLLLGIVHGEGNLVKIHHSTEKVAGVWGCDFISHWATGTLLWRDF